MDTTPSFIRQLSSTSGPRTASGPSPGPDFGPGRAEALREPAAAAVARKKGRVERRGTWTAGQRGTGSVVRVE